MRISDWSSDVCSSDLFNRVTVPSFKSDHSGLRSINGRMNPAVQSISTRSRGCNDVSRAQTSRTCMSHPRIASSVEMIFRSEEHTSELQSLMRISYAVFCLKKKKQQNKRPHSS